VGAKLHAPGQRALRAHGDAVDREQRRPDAEPGRVEQEVDAQCTALERAVAAKDELARRRDIRLAPFERLDEPDAVEIAFGEVGPDLRTEALRGQRARNARQRERDRNDERCANTD
jgi:hypothetical protein